MQMALPDELITRIENVSEQLAPTNPFNLYQHLFTDQTLISTRRMVIGKSSERTRRGGNGHNEIFQQNGVECHPFANP